MAATTAMMSPGLGMMMSKMIMMSTTIVTIMMMSNIRKMATVILSEEILGTTFGATVNNNSLCVETVHCAHLEDDEG